MFDAAWENELIRFGAYAPLSTDFDVYVSWNRQYQSKAGSRKTLTVQLNMVDELTPPILTHAEF